MEETTIETYEQYLILKDAVKEYERELRRKKKRFTDVQKRNIIAETVREYYNESEAILKAKCRERSVVQTRQVTYYLVRKYTKQSLTKTGKIYSQDHSNVIHGRKTIIDLIETDSRMFSDVSTLEKQLLEIGIMPTILGLHQMRYNTQQKKTKRSSISLWWTVDRVNLLKTCYGKIGTVEIAKVLQTTPIKVQQKLEELNLKAA